MILIVLARPKAVLADAIIVVQVLVAALVKALRLVVAADAEAVVWGHAKIRV